MRSLTNYFSRDLPQIRDIPTLLSIFDDSDNFFNRRSLGFLSDFDNVKVDVVENAENVEVTAVTPGFDKKDIKIEYDKGYLTVSGEVKEEKEEKKYLYREIGSKKFTRKFQLGDTFDKENIDASFKNGVLVITLPKKEEEKFKEIQIN
jgi:HSP20 family protein